MRTNIDADVYNAHTYTQNFTVNLERIESMRKKSQGNRKKKHKKNRGNGTD